MNITKSHSNRRGWFVIGAKIKLFLLLKTFLMNQKTGHEAVQEQKKCNVTISKCTHIKNVVYAINPFVESLLREFHIHQWLQLLEHCIEKLLRWRGSTATDRRVIKGSGRLGKSTRIIKIILSLTISKAIKMRQKRSNLVLLRAICEERATQTHAAERFKLSRQDIKQ